MKYSDQVASSIEGITELNLYFVSLPRLTPICPFLAVMDKFLPCGFYYDPKLPNVARLVLHNTKLKISDKNKISFFALNECYDQANIVRVGI